MTIDNAKVIELRNQINIANQAIVAARAEVVKSNDFQIALKAESDKRIKIENAIAKDDNIVNIKNQIIDLQNQIGSLIKQREDAVSAFVTNNPALGLSIPVNPQLITESFPSVVAAIAARDALVSQLQLAMKG